MKKGPVIISAIIITAILGFIYFNASATEKNALYPPGKINKPALSYNPPAYTFAAKQYKNEEYKLPLKALPENYERDINGKFKLALSEQQKQLLFKNGVVMIPGDSDRFEQAYKQLSTSQDYEVNGKPQYDQSGIPIIITTDSVMHMFHIEFNELLKNIEVTKLSPLLKDFLSKVMNESITQYNGFADKELKELSRRNAAFLAVAMKLLEPSFTVPATVQYEVNQEIKKIEAHNGFYKNELFSKNCPDECSNRLYPPSQEFRCNQEVKGEVSYQGKVWLFEDLYVKVCSRTCYCEDYSQYIPRGHYTSSEALKRYFKAMMWLGRMTFKVNGSAWTKQAILLTDAVKSAGAIDSWRKIYSVTGFFAGASEDLTFYEYDTAISELFNYGFDEIQILHQGATEKIHAELRTMKGPKILGGFEFDLAGNLKDTTQGLRIIGQRYAIDSHILSELVYNNVGVNPASEHYKRVLQCDETTQKLSKPESLYATCASMDKDKIIYWNEVSAKAMEMYYYKFCKGLDEQQLYSVARFMPTGLDVMSVLGSRRADEILARQKISTYCDYDKKNKEMKDLVNSYDINQWTENLYNTWLWMIQPVLFEKPAGYPNWMRSGLWKNKELITALASWAQLRHDTILYVKQSYTRAVMMPSPTAARPPEPIAAKYYGYVEPNPELYARAHYIVTFLISGLAEQGLLSDTVKTSLEQSKEMMMKLQNISSKELEQIPLSEDDYDYIKNIDALFNSIIESLASALTVSDPKPDGPATSHTSLAGKDDAFKTTIVADVHTETNTKKVLEVATGKIDWVIVAHASKDGHIGLAVGPIFSYYEFPHPMSDRLTDEKWRELLQSKPPSRKSADF